MGTFGDHPEPSMILIKLNLNKTIIIALHQDVEDKLLGETIKESICMYSNILKAIFRKTRIGISSTLQSTGTIKMPTLYIARIYI